MAPPFRFNLVEHQYDGTSVIALTQGKSTIIDTAQYNLVKNYHWFAWTQKSSGISYARARVRGENRTITMHQLLCPCLIGFEPDHRDRDGLNNRLTNLRPATRSENCLNRKPMEHSSKFRGVSWVKHLGKWKATIKKDGKIFNLGCFLSEEEAYHQRLKSEKEFFPGFERHLK